MPRPLSDDEVTAFRERIREVAERQFAKRGFEGVTMRSLADELDCSRMTPYRYFADKGAIFAMVRTAAYQRFATAQERAAASAQDPTERLSALGRAYVAFALEEPNAYRLMFELAQPNPDGYPELRDAETRTFAPLRRAVEAAIERGVLQGDPETVAHLFWGSAHGIVSLELAGKLVHGRRAADLIEPMLLHTFRGAQPR